MDNGNKFATKPKIGVFDSGIFGLSIAEAIKKEYPTAEIIFRQDEAHFPYGTRPPAQLLRFVEPILWSMVREGCGIIVIACNTVTTTLIGQLQQRLSVPLVGVEPMIQAASELTKTGKIAVCASPTTLSSKPYHLLKSAYAAKLKIFEPECRDWPYMDKHDPVDDINVGMRIREVLDAGVDVIVMSCTHYHWIEDKINYLAANKATLLVPEDATVRQLKKALADINLSF